VSSAWAQRNVATLQKKRRKGSGKIWEKKKNSDKGGRCYRGERSYLYEINMVGGRDLLSPKKPGLGNATSRIGTNCKKQGGRNPRRHSGKGRADQVMIKSGELARAWERALNRKFFVIKKGKKKIINIGWGKPGKKARTGMKKKTSLGEKVGHKLYKQPKGTWGKGGGGGTTDTGGETCEEQDDPERGNGVVFTLLYQGRGQNASIHGGMGGGPRGKNGPVYQASHNRKTKRYKNEKDHDRGNTNVNGKWGLLGKQVGGGKNGRFDLEKSAGGV